MHRTSMLVKEKLLCTFLIGIILVSTTQGNGEQQSIDTHNAVAGQFFHLRHGIAPTNLGEDVNIIWSRGANGSLDGTSSRVRIINGSLFFLPVRLSDSGYYTWKKSDVSSDVTGPRSVERKMLLSVVEGTCPQHSDSKAFQKGHTGSLHCKQPEIFALDKSAEISWLKDCNPMNVHEQNVRINNVGDKDEGKYTCLINFTFEGKKFTTSSTIQLKVKDDPASLEPKVIRPQNETIKVRPGVEVDLECEVFVGMNEEISDETIVYWLVNNSHIEMYSSLMKNIDEVSKKSTGIYKSSTLVISEVRPELFHVSFQCVVINALSRDVGVVRLVPDDGEHRYVFFCAAVPAIVVMVMIFLRFKVEVVLTYRSLRPLVCSQRNDDGKLYDAYVSCLHSQALCSFQLENFCLQVLPEVLEHRHGYNLFVRGRDDLPGESAQDVISEAIRKSRRMIIVVSSQDQSDVDPEGSALSGLKLYSDQGRDVDQPDLEQQIGLFDALVENRLQVILVEIGKCVEYSFYPESIRYLKHKQGALRYKPSPGDPMAPPNHRFWKYLRYHMPHSPVESASTKPVPRLKS